MWSHIVGSLDVGMYGCMDVYMYVGWLVGPQLVSDDFLGKYGVDFDEISHTCSLSERPDTSRFSDRSDNRGSL